MALKKNFNASRQGHGSQQKHRGDGIGQLECWTCSKEHLKRYFPWNQGGRPLIYSAQEVQTIWDVGHSVPRFYAKMDNRHANHQESIIELMDGKLCDQVVSILMWSLVIPNK